MAAQQEILLRHQIINKVLIRINHLYMEALEVEEPHFRVKHLKRSKALLLKAFYMEVAFDIHMRITQLFRVTLTHLTAKHERSEPEWPILRTYKTGHLQQAYHSICKKLV